jgi:hypothetical protein
MAGTRKNMWRNPVYEIMRDRALASHEIPFILTDKYKNVPSSVKISAVLNRDERFKQVGYHHCAGLYSKKSHRVLFFGRSDMEYEDFAPFKAITEVEK